MKKKIISLFIGSFLILGLAACGGGNDNGSKNGGGDTAGSDGEKLFAQQCASCHGGDLKSGYAPDLDKIGSKYSKEDIQKIIEEGIGSMPAGLLKGEDAAKVAEWLASKK